MVEVASADFWEDKGTESRSVAVISGKGGSGKTMVAAVIGELLSFNHQTIIVDADTGTGGMTYYLALKLVQNTRVGLSNVAVALEKPHPPAKPSPEAAKPGPEGSDSFLVLRNLQPILSRENRENVESQSFDSGRFGAFEDAQFFGVGDHRLLLRAISEDKFPSILKHVVRTLQAETQSWIVVDCRGGIDRESVAVCQEVDDILLVVEPDTTSFQATQHVVDTLSENDLARKIRGFIVNKVIDDPTVVARNGTSVFGAQYLSSIPFDFEATRAFLVGEVPRTKSVFGIHIWQAMYRAYPDDVPSPPGRPWDPEDFRKVGLMNIESVRGGIVVAGLILLLGITLIFASVFLPSGLVFLQSMTGIYVLIGLLILGLIGSIEPTRRAVGKAMEFYMRAADRLLSGGRSG
jgi:septum site-determining protein MinD